MVCKNYESPQKVNAVALRWKNGGICCGFLIFYHFARNTVETIMIYRNFTMKRMKNKQKWGIIIV